MLGSTYTSVLNVPGCEKGRGEMKLSWTQLPSYEELPIDPAKPPRSAWGVFGDDDELGTLNLLTPARAKRAIPTS